MRFRSKSCLLLVIVLGLLLVVTACGKKETENNITADEPAQEQKVLKIGSLMPLSGPASPYGQGLKPGMEIYADLLNEGGGVKIGDDTYKVELYFGDTKVDPKTAALAVQELINKDGVSYFVGSFDSFLAVAAVTEPAKAIYMQYAQYGYDAAKMPHVVFPVPSTLQFGNELKVFLDKYPDTKVLALNSYDVQAQIFNPIFEKMAEPGGILAERGIKLVILNPPIGADWATWAQKAVDQKVDAVFAVNGPADDAMMVKELAATGRKVHYAIGGAIIDVKAFTDIAGNDAAQGVMGEYAPPWELKKTVVSPDMLAMAKTIYERLQQKTGLEDPYVGGFSWGTNQMAILIQAAQKAGSLDTDKIMEQIRGGTFDTFIGKYTMSGEKTMGSPIVMGSPAAMGEIQGERLVLAGEEPLPTIP